MILQIFFMLVLVGILLWALNAFIPLQPQVKSLINVLAIILLVFWLLKVFHVFEYVKRMGL